MSQSRSRKLIALAAHAALCEPRGDGVHALAVLAAGHAVERAGVHHHARARVRLGPVDLLRHRAQNRRGDRVDLLGGNDDGDDRQAVLACELEVALVAAGNRHDGAGAVVHEHVVGDPDRDQPAVDRVLDVAARERAVLGALPYLPLDGGLACGAGDDLVDGVGIRRARDQPSDERMLGREQEERAAEQRVGARREHGDALVGGLVGLVAERELDLGAFAAADPVGLHALDALGPAGQLVEIVEEPLRVVGDLEVPLLELALLDHALAAPALAVADDLLVGEHRRAAPDTS